MTDTPDVLRLMEQVAARAGGDDDPAEDRTAETSPHDPSDAPPPADDHPAGGRAASGPVPEPPPRSEAARAAHHHLHEASEFAAAGTVLPDRTRLRPVKQTLLTLLRPVTSHQVPFNEQMIAAVDGLVGEVERLEHDLARQEQRATRLQASAATTDLTVDDLNDTVKALTTEIDAQADVTERLVATVDDLGRVVDELRSAAADLTALRSEVATVRARQSLVLRAAAAALPGGFDAGQLAAMSRELSTDTEALYEDLEDTFRGSREAVMAMQAVYVDDIRAVPGRAPVVDVGCGRGEWLEVLRDAGVDGYGVDPNEVLVQRCRARGLDVRLEDALVHLRGLPEGSVGAVTAFHVVEHLALDTLVQLVDAALVALRPGGLLIVETPNPTNLNVGAASFYLDPTHVKPLHPQFLEFLAVARGFVEVEVRYLHSDDGARLEPADLSEAAGPRRAEELVERINWSLFGPLDYAVLARKSGPVTGSAG